MIPITQLLHHDSAAKLRLSEVLGTFRRALDDFSARVSIDAEEQGKKARETGTEIHGMIESGFLSGNGKPYYIAVKDWLDTTFPNQVWSSEKSFSSTIGYGGKCDLHSSGVVVDFKTKDFKDTDDVTKFVYDEHGMQLSAYGRGYGLHNFMRCNIYVRPMKDGDEKPLVMGYVHPAETEQTHWETFASLLRYWQLSKGPR